MENKLLLGIGLTEQQSKVYLKLLEIGPSGVGKFTKFLNISRISCYDTLNRLISKGLVSFDSVGKHRLYQAVNPKRLLLMAKEKEKSAIEYRKKIEKIIPKLEDVKKKKNEEDRSATYRTKEGIKSIFELMLESSNTIYIISATGKALQEMRYYFPNWHRRRVKKKIKLKILFNRELMGKSITKAPLSEVKFLLKEYSSPTTIFIFEDYVVNLIWQDVPVAFLLESKKISKSYRNYFKSLWKQPLTENL